MATYEHPNRQARNNIYQPRAPQGANDTDRDPKVTNS